MGAPHYTAGSQTTIHTGLLNCSMSSWKLMNVSKHWTSLKKWYRVKGKKKNHSSCHNMYILYFWLTKHFHRTAIDPISSSSPPWPVPLTSPHMDNGASMIPIHQHLRALLEKASSIHSLNFFFFLFFFFFFPHPSLRSGRFCFSVTLGNGWNYSKFYPSD